MYIEQNNQHRGWVIRGIIFTAFIVVVYKLILHKPGVKIEKTDNYSISNVVDSSKVEPRTGSDIIGQNGNSENFEAVKDIEKEPKGTVVSVKSKVESPTTHKTTNIVGNAKELEFEPNIRYEKKSTIKVPSIQRITSKNTFYFDYIPNHSRDNFFF